MKPFTRKVIIGSGILILLSLIAYGIERLMWQKRLRGQAHVTWNAYHVDAKGDTTLRKTGSAEIGVLDENSSQEK